MTQKLSLTWLAFSLFFVPFCEGLNFRPNTDALRTSFSDLMRTNELPSNASAITESVEEDEDLFSQNTKKFVLKSLTLSGSTLLKEEEIKPLYESFLGQEISTAILGEIAEKATALYRKKGYVFSRVYVPFQNTETGNVSLKAIEGGIKKVAYRWINMPAHPELKGILEEIKSVHPFTTEALEMVIRHVRRMPGYAISFTLKPSKEHKNQGDLMVVITRQAVTYKGGVSDTMPTSLGKWVAQGAINLNSILGLGEKLKLYGAIYPNHTFKNLMFYGGQFSFPLSDKGTNLLLHVDWLRNQPNLRDAGIEKARGKLKTYGIGISQELIQDPDLVLSLSVLLDRKKFSETTQRVGGAFSSVEEKNLAFRLGTNFEFKDDAFGKTKVRLMLHKGLNDKHSRASGATTGHLTFSKITAQLQQIYDATDALSFVAFLRGQQAFSTPIHMEKFFHGGAPFAVASPVGVLSGDSGFQGKFEVRYALDISDFLQNLVTYGYYDYGRVSSKHADQNGKKKDSLSTLGIGLRGNLENGLSVFVEYGIPFKRKYAHATLPQKFYAGLAFNTDYGG